MTRLVGAAWGVSFDQLPHQAFTIHQGGGGGGGSLISMSTMPYGEDCNEISGIFFIKIQNMQSCDRIPYIHFLLSVFRLNFGHRFI
jgi:hypothetical protein